MSIRPGPPNPWPPPKSIEPISPPMTRPPSMPPQRPPMGEEAPTGFCWLKPGCDWGDVGLGLGAGALR